MLKPRQLQETIHNKFNTALGKRIISHNHRGRRVEKAYNAASFLSNGRVHFGELCLAWLFMVGLTIRGSSENLPNNATLLYPLHKISTLECRTQLFSSLSEDCKTNLPIIHGADYTTYQNEKTYTDMYTVLRGASYTHPRNQAVGAHYGVDIATSKGTPIYAIADGEVHAAEYNSAYGNVVKIRFRYKGETLYAVYAHMHSYSVKAGDIIKKGQQIWEVGNSGNTSGGLGGNHLHFEISKDNGGKPAYAYTNCESLSKGHYEIIQKGLCRIELFQYTKDPIALLEGAKANYPNLPPEGGLLEKPNQPHPAPAQPETPTLNNETEKKNQISLDFSSVDLVGKEFVNKREISMEKDFWEVVNLNDTLTFTIKIKNKITGENFHGTLSQPLLFIANNTHLQINPVSTVLIAGGTSTVTLTPTTKGNTYIALNLGTTRIGGITVSIQ